MEAIIDRGESVVIDGEIIFEKEKLPTEAALAKGNKEAEKAAKESIKAQMDALKEQLALLDEPAGEPVEEKAPDENYVDINAREEEARKEDDAKKAEAAVKAEEARKTAEEKKADAVKKEEAKKA